MQRWAALSGSGLNLCDGRATRCELDPPEEYQPGKHDWHVLAAALDSEERRTTRSWAEKRMRKASVKVRKCEKWHVKSMSNQCNTSQILSNEISSMYTGRPAGHEHPW